MSEDNFDFELVSPERKLMEEKAWQVTIPGYEGDFGVRAGHSSIVSSVRPGVVEIIEQQGKEPVRVFIAGGFADVTATNCTVLAEEAYMVSDLNQKELEREISDLSTNLEKANDDIEVVRFQGKLNIAKAKLTAVTGSLAT